MTVIVPAPGSMVMSQPGFARTTIFSLPAVSSKITTLPDGVRRTRRSGYESSASAGT